MKLTELQEEFPKTIKSSPPRSEGVHITDIISDLERELGVEYDNKWDQEILFEIGFMWEELLSLAFAERMAERPDELELDGIYLSPDGITDEAVEEYKCTFKSSRKTPEDIWRWMVQTKGYCKACERTKVVFRVLYLMGDYKGSGPQYKVYEIEFTEMEIEENWSMIQAHKNHRGW